MWGLKRKTKKTKERDSEKEFRMAVGLLMKAECERHTSCEECLFRNRAGLECVSVIRECGV